MAMEIDNVALDDIISKKGIGKKFHGGRGDGRRSNDGPRGGAVNKKSKQWGHDKFFELDNGGRGGNNNRRGGGSPQRSLFSTCRFSNIPFHITQEELQELFSKYTGLKSVVLHHDEHGNSLGTAEARGPTNDIKRLYKEFDRCRIDDRTVKAVLLTDDSGPQHKGIVERVQRNRGGGGGDRRRRNDDGGARANGGRRGGAGGPRAPKKQKLTAEELDRELDEYMKNKTS